MKVIFDTKNIYYLPQYEPIIKVLRERGHTVECVVYQDKNDASLAERVITGVNYAVRPVRDEQAALEYYLQQQPDWVFFGNQFAYLDELHQVAHSAQLGHGIGPKPSYYTKSRTPMSVRFIEGAQRLEKICQMFPGDRFVQVGYSKLDPLFSGEVKGLDLPAVGLDPQRKTLLYAPTFNPCSIERFPDNWPDDFADYNILIKVHAFTWQRSRYLGQRRKLKNWSSFDNVYVADQTELSLLPFMAAADLLISEASSTLFEFAALDRPVVVCNFFKLKWFYRGPFRYRFEKRFRSDAAVHYRNIGPHADSYSELKAEIYRQLSHPDEYSKQRRLMTQQHVGPTDGQASQRIVDYLETH
jgi:CDP-glycerol glycerophosphotransferase (TagB/SpsB family)